MPDHDVIEFKDLQLLFPDNWGKLKPNGSFFGPYVRMGDICAIRICSAGAHAHDLDEEWAIVYDGANFKYLPAIYPQAWWMCDISVEVNGIQGVTGGICKLHIPSCGAVLTSDIVNGDDELATNPFSRYFAFTQKWQLQQPGWYDRVTWFFVPQRPSIMTSLRVDLELYIEK